MSQPAKKADYGFIRQAFLVKRYHTCGHVAMPESVGHHTANVVAILFFLFDDSPPLYLIRHALHHDVPELVTGDIPATTKWQNTELKALLDKMEGDVATHHGLETSAIDPLHMDLLKFADMMDLCFKGIEEMTTGNDTFIPIVGRGINYCVNLLTTSLKDHTAAHQLWAIFKNNRFINIEEFIVDFNPEGFTKH